MLPCLALIASIGVLAAANNGKSSWTPASIIGNAVKKAGSAATVLGISNHPTHPSNANLTASKSRAKSQSTPAQSSAHTAIAYGHAEVSSSSIPPGHLIMSPSIFVAGNNYSPEPRLYMSNNIEVNQPAAQRTPDLSLDWYDDGQGHDESGNYYHGWKPMIQRLHPDGDIQNSFTITVHDLAGNDYSTNLTVIWMAPRNLGMSAGSMSKQVVGNNVVYTGQVLFSPTPNVGNPIVHIADNGFYNFGKDPCDVSETNASFTFTGQSYDITCVISSDNLKNYPNGFDIYAEAQAQWPPASPLTFTTKFHAN
ncbi:MAG TPA: hypothetical protein VGH44_03325 [Candidatus Saccharimonadia bacterium]